MKNMFQRFGVFLAALVFLAASPAFAQVDIAARGMAVQAQLATANAQRAFALVDKKIAAGQSVTIAFWQDSTGTATTSALGAASRWPEQWAINDLPIDVPTHGVVINVWSGSAYLAPVRLSTGTTSADINIYLFAVSGSIPEYGMGSFWYPALASIDPDLLIVPHGINLKTWTLAIGPAFVAAWESYRAVHPNTPILAITEHPRQDDASHEANRTALLAAAPNENVFTNDTVYQQFLAAGKPLSLYSEASFTGSISGTTLTIPGTIAGGLFAGAVLKSGSGVTAGTTVLSGSGTTWTVSPSQTAASTAMVFSDPVHQSDVAGNALYRAMIRAEMKAGYGSQIYGPQISRLKMRAGPQNLLINGGLSTWSNTAVAPDSWTSGGTITFTKDTSDYADEAQPYSVSMVGSGSGQTYITQSVGGTKLATLKGKPVTLAARLKKDTAGAANLGRIAIHWTCTATGAQSFTKPGNLIQQGDYVWNLLTITTCTDLTFLAVRIYQDSATTPDATHSVKVDQVSLVPGTLPMAAR